MTCKQLLSPSSADKLLKLKKRLNITQNRRIPHHFDTEGKQPHEPERTRSWHYSHFNLEAYSQLAKLGEKNHVDIWDHHVDNHNLHNGYHYIAQFIDSKTS